MKSSLAQAAVFFSAFVSGLPSAHRSSLNSPAKDITAVAGTTDPQHITIHFQVPCHGCFIDADDGLELTLEIDAADEECSSGTPRLNGLPLSLSEDTNIANGQISFKSKPLNGLYEQEVHAAWQSTCLRGEASILSVRFNDVAGKENCKDASGFTASFKQKGKPTILRLQDKPVEHIASQSTCDGWLLPEDKSLSIIPVSADSVTSTDTQLQIEYLKLEHLKAEIDQLHEQMRENSGRVLSLLKQDFKACSNIRCLWQTAVSKAPTVKKLISLCFSHHRKSRNAGCTDGAGQKACSTKAPDDLPEPAPSAEEFEKVHIDEAGTPPSPQEPAQAPPDMVDGPLDHRPPFEGGPPDVPFEGVEHPHPPFEGDRPHHPFGPPFRGGHPPFGPPHPPPQRMPHHPPGHHGPPPPPPFGPHGHPRFGRISDEGRRYHSHIRLALAVSTLVLLVILSGLAFRLIRKSAWYRDPRRQADRAARREERRTRKLYRKAACKHKWATWLKHYRRNSSTNDYEEKRDRILEREGLLDDVMQNEFRALRNASDLVRDLVRVEEGRARLNGYNPQQGPYSYSPAELEAGVGGSNLSDAPPSYMAPPPQYEAELEGELTVVDGFRYTPSNTDETPESSIIDCSPRLSVETGRSTVFTKDARD